MSGSQLTVRLYRDSFNTPWGFRLQGGKDLGQPLSIQRVFSNSPAEGELQRGDLILAIGGKDASELTHKQAQDLIKFGGGQIQLVIQRPPPGRVQTTITIKPQRPRAPSLQMDRMRENMTPATEAFIKGHLERIQHLINEQKDESPSSPAMLGEGVDWPHDPCYNPNFPPQQHSPSFLLSPPPWTSQNFSPKKVSKLSRLGGGGMDFGVDYSTMPRRRHSTQVHSAYSNGQSTNRDPPRVASLSRLGGGGFDFGVDYCTLPRTRHRQSSQPPASPQTAMPTSGYGFQPKKLTVSRLGGGGPEFGSDYSSYRPVSVQTRSPQQGDMLNRVQESLDISLSPRTPDYYQPPPFASPTSPPQYIPTGVRLDMEREQELQRQREQELLQQRQRQQQQQQLLMQQYQQPQQQQPSYTPTGVLLDQQRGEGEEQEVELVPVHERRKAFLNAPSQPPAVKKTGKKISRQLGGGKPDFGVDYSKPQSRTSSVTWKPQPAQRPVNVPPPPQQEIVQSTPPAWKASEDGERGPPVWRETLRTTGVKPWDTDLEYTAQQQQAPRSVPFQPKVDASPYTPSQIDDKQEDGPKVVHLQYNSPIGLYSKQNVKETYIGQTKVLSAGGPSSGQTQVQNPAKPGDRDWTQSAVYRMIYEEEQRGRPVQQQPQQQQQQQPPQQQQQQQQQQRSAPPPKAPKPQPAFKQSFTPLDDELGISDF